MSTRIDDDAALFALLRETFDAVEADQDGWPHTMPPWERITAGMKKVRRGRRWRVVRRAAAGLLAVTAAGAGVMTGVVPYPGFAPTVTIPGVSGGHSAMYDGPTRGSLAQHGEWLEQFRHRVADERPEHEGDGETWTPPDADGVHVLYAGDVGEFRVALVEGDWTWGPIAAPQQVWYLGRVGYGAADMIKGGNSDPYEAAATTVAPANFPHQLEGESQDAVAVVVGSHPVDVRVSTPPEIDADAKVTRHEKKVDPQPDGTYVVQLPAPQTYTVLVDGRDVLGTVVTASDDGSASDREYERRSGVMVPLRGGPGFKSSVFGMLGDNAVAAVQQPYGSGRLDVLAAAPAGTPQRVVVGVLRLDSGARVVVSAAILEETANAGSYANEAAALLPAGSNDDIAFAFRSFPAEYHDRPDWTAAVGPEGTTTVQWVHASGGRTSSPAQHALATTPGHDVVSVRFLDADGKVLAVAPVTVPRPPDDQVLPEVKGR